MVGSGRRLGAEPREGVEERDRRPVAARREDASWRRQHPQPRVDLLRGLGQAHARAGQRARDLHGDPASAALGVRVDEDGEAGAGSRAGSAPASSAGSAARPSKAALDDTPHLASSSRRARPCLGRCTGAGSIFSWIVTRTLAPAVDRTPFAAQDVARPAERHGQDREPRLEREVERALLEGQELPLRLRVPSGAIHTWVPLASKARASSRLRMARWRSLRSIEMNPAASSAPAEDGDTEELLLGDHPDVRPDHVEEYGDVIQRLVVAHHEVRLVAAQVLASVHDRPMSRAFLTTARAHPSRRSSQIFFVRPSLERVQDRRQRDRQRLVDVLAAKVRPTRSSADPEVTRKPSPRGASPALAIASWPP